MIHLQDLARYKPNRLASDFHSKVNISSTPSHESVYNFSQNINPPVASPSFKSSPIPARRFTPQAAEPKPSITNKVFSKKRNNDFFVTLRSKIPSITSGKYIMKYHRSIDGYKNLEIPISGSTIYNDRVVLHTTSNSNQEKLNFRMAKDTHLTITTQHLPNPRVFIGDIPSEVSSEDITESILKLDLFKDESLKPQLKVVRSITKPNNDYFSLILEVPAKIYGNLLRLGKFTAAFAYLSIQESKATRICFNCGCHKHLKKDFKNSPVCLNCANSHPTNTFSDNASAQLK